MKSPCGAPMALTALLTAIALGGCASVNVDRAKNVSAAGVAYTQATEAVIDLAIDASIDASSERQVRSKPRGAVSEQDQRAREVSLKAIDEALVANATKYTLLKHSVTMMEAYFKALQQLADGSPTAATDVAVRSLADRINGVNAAMDKSGAGVPRISDAQKGAIAALSQIVVQQVHGAMLGKALERDAATIGRALVLQEMVLKEAGEDIRGALNDASQRFYVDRVVTPYRSGNIGDGWVSDRRVALKVQALGNSSESVASAEAAAGQMQTVWLRVLSGEYSAKEMTAMLRDTEDLLAAVAALRAANAMKPGATTQ